MNLAASTLATSGSPPPFLRHRIRVPLRVPLRGGDGAAAGASEPSAPLVRRLSSTRERRLPPPLVLRLSSTRERRFCSTLLRRAGGAAAGAAAHNSIASYRLKKKSR